MAIRGRSLARAGIPCVALAMLAALQPRPPRPQESGAPPSPTSAGAGETLWSRLHSALARRDEDGGSLGLDEPELLLWPDSRHYLEPERCAELLAVLAEAEAAPPEKRLDDPVALLLLQQDLWKAFDWAVQPDPHGAEEASDCRARLAAALARALVRLAPSAEAWAALPDSLAGADAAWTLRREPDPLAPREPFLPAGLAAETGPWVRLAEDGVPSRPLAIAHAHAHGGRSAFEIRLRVPGGREAALELLSTLRSRGWTRRCSERSCGLPDSEREPDHEHLSRDLPQLPPGTAVALIERALAIDSGGHIHGTPVVKRLQVRVFLQASGPERGVPEHGMAEPGGWPWQAVAELALDRRRLLRREAGGLVPVGPDQAAFAFVMTHGDPLARSRGFPRRATLDSCVGCHGAEGLASVVAFTQQASGPGTQLQMPLSFSPRRLVEADAAEALGISIEWKRARADWRKLWELGAR